MLYRELLRDLVRKQRFAVTTIKNRKCFSIVNLYCLLQQRLERRHSLSYQTKFGSAMSGSMSKRIGGTPRDRGVADLLTRVTMPNLVVLR